MRTNIELDDALVAEAFKYTVTRSKKALVQEALSVYVAIKREERRRLSYRERLQQVRARTDRLRGTRNAHEIVRQDRAAMRRSLPSLSRTRRPSSRQNVPPRAGSRNSVT